MRPAVGLIAIVLLVAGSVALAIGAESMQAFAAASIRVGVVMSLVWLAMPQLERLPRWLPIAVVALAVVLAIRPRLFPLGLVVVLLLWFLRPRNHQRRTRTS